MPPTTLSEQDLRDIRIGLESPDATDAEILLALRSLAVAGFLIVRRATLVAELAKQVRMAARSLAADACRVAALLDRVPDDAVLTPHSRDELLALAALPPVPEEIPSALCV